MKRIITALLTTAALATPAPAEPLTIEQMRKEAPALIAEYCKNEGGDDRFRLSSAAIELHPSWQAMIQRCLTPLPPREGLHAQAAVGFAK
jgi:hypothetical protein